MGHLRQKIRRAELADYHPGSHIYPPDEPWEIRTSGSVGGLFISYRQNYGPIGPCAHLNQAVVLLNSGIP